MKIALITGASTGIGLHLARELARRGWRVALLARRQELLEQEVALLAASGQTAMALACDVADAAAVKAAVAQVEQTWGPIDLAIANAGLGDPTPLAQMQLADAAYIMNVNFMGMLHLFDAVRPSMLARRSGHFVGVASLAGFRGLPQSGVYSASKAAMQAFLEAARIELLPLGITVSTVNPGFVKTPLTDRNTVKKPFMISPERAAVIVANGLERRAREVNFPEPTATAMRLLRLAPNWLFDAVVGAGARRLMAPGK